MDTVQDTDTGQLQYPDYGSGLHTAPSGMQGYNGLETWKPNRRAPQVDYDGYPWQIRRYLNMGVTDVQLGNGLRHKVASGRRWGYRGTGYLYTVQPIIPGQMRDNVAGFHKKPPSPYNVADVWAAGPGAQPEHPGGPGKIAAPTFINPMTG